jgi:hypothetical protein
MVTGLSIQIFTTFIIHLSTLVFIILSVSLISSSSSSSIVHSFTNFWMDRHIRHQWIQPPLFVIGEFMTAISSRLSSVATEQVCAIIEGVCWINLSSNRYFWHLSLAWVASAGNSSYQYLQLMMKMTKEICRVFLSEFIIWENVRARKVRCTHCLLVNEFTGQ